MNVTDKDIIAITIYNFENISNKCENFILEW